MNKEELLRKFGWTVICIDFIFLMLALCPAKSEPAVFFYGWLIGLVTTCIAIAGVVMINWTSLSRFIKQPAEVPVPDTTPPGAGS